MAESTADGRGGGDDDPIRPPEEADLGAAVDDALKDEVRRQKARFVQRILGIDRREGVGRSDERWDEGFSGDPDPDRPDDRG